MDISEEYDLDRVYVILAGNPHQVPYRCSERFSRLVERIVHSPMHQRNIYFYPAGEPTW